MHQLLGGGAGWLAVPLAGCTWFDFASPASPTVGDCFGDVTCTKVGHRYGLRARDQVGPRSVGPTFSPLHSKQLCCAILHERSNERSFKSHTHFMRSTFQPGNSVKTNLFNPLWYPHVTMFYSVSIYFPIQIHWFIRFVQSCFLFCIYFSIFWLIH